MDVITSKAGLIEMLAHANVPEDLKLVGGVGEAVEALVKTFDIHNKGKMHAVIATELLKKFTEATGGLGDELTPEHFTRLHEASMDYHQAIIDVLFL